MGINLIIGTSGKGSYKKVDSDDLLKDVIQVSVYSERFKLHKAKGRPKEIFHKWILKEVCKNENVNFKEIMEYAEGKRKEILDKWYNKTYLEEGYWEDFYKEIKSKNIPTPYGN